MQMFGETGKSSLFRQNEMDVPLELLNGLGWSQAECLWCKPQYFAKEMTPSNHVEYRSAALLRIWGNARTCSPCAARVMAMHPMHGGTRSCLPCLHSYVRV